MYNKYLYTSNNNCKSNIAAIAQIAQLVERPVNAFGNSCTTAVEV